MGPDRSAVDDPPLTRLWFSPGGRGAAEAAREPGTASIRLDVEPMLLLASRCRGDCGQIKSGAPARGERTAKYNRLIEVESTVGLPYGLVAPTGVGPSTGR
jgi:hypothetical protein